MSASFPIAPTGPIATYSSISRRFIFGSIRSSVCFSKTRRAKALVDQVVMFSMFVGDGASLLGSPTALCGSFFDNSKS
ncbi:Transcriptional regulatory protein moc3 [Fusarium oxysporum f. sp. albedinis]|nr:Transcriptional regulatory protein moc3 [Fusarium oxysporum f. sp. albedinis]